MRKGISGDTIVIGLALLGLVGSFTLVFNDSLLASLLFKSQASKTPEIGTVSKSQSDVRRRLVQNLNWLPLSQNTSVFEGDTLFTGPKSEAEVSLKTGSRIGISENSLIVLSLASGQPDLDVQYGVVVSQIAATDKIKVRLNGEETELTGQNAKVEIRADGKKAELSVLEGEIKLKTRTTQSRVKKSEVVRVTERGKAPEVLSTRAVLLEPRDRALLWSQAGQPIQFKWDAPVTEKNFEVQVSQDATFREIIASENVSALEWKKAGLQKAGTVYWRVRSLDRQGVATAPFMLTLKEDAIPVLLEPAPQQAFLLDKDLKGQVLPQKSILLKWQDASQPKSFKVQLATTPDFAAPTVSELEAKEAQLQTVPLNAGNYFWRVQAIDSEREKLAWSEARSFSLAAPVPEKAAELPAPQLVQTQIQDELVLLEEGVKNPPRLTWSKVEDAIGYQLEIAQALDARFAQPVLRTRLKVNEYTWKKSEPGNYIWRVRSINKDSVPGEATKTAKLDLSVAPPDLLSTNKIVDRVPSSKDLNRPLKNVDLKWQAIPRTEGYQLQIASNPDFTDAQDMTAKAPQVSVKAPRVGRTYWHVRPVDKEGKPMGRFSKPESFEYERIVELELPKAVTPKAESTVIFVGGGQANIIFEWDKVIGAKFYTLELSSEPNFTKIIYSQKLQSTRTLVTRDLPQGQYFWRVKAMGSQVGSSWAGPNSFNLEQRIGRKPASP